MPLTRSCAPATGALAAVCLAALVLPLSFSAGAVATPAIGRALGGEAGALVWITNAFMLSFGACVMAAGALADRYGRKRVFLLGVGGFALASLAACAAPSVLLLDLARAAQGVCAAAALSGGSAALAQEFEGGARLRAFSLLGATFGLGLALGPTLAGALLESAGWRAVFLAPGLVAAAALPLGAARLRESRDPGAARFDRTGALCFTAMLSALTFGLLEAPERGWVAAPVLVAAAALAVAFAAIEKRAERPMLDLDLLREPRFLGAQLLPIGTCFCYVVLLVALPLRFLGVEGRGETEAGLMMAALSAPMLAAPALAALVTRRWTAGAACAAGLLIAAAGLLWLGAVAPGPGLAVLGPMLLIGVGAALPWGLMDGLAISVAPKERAGMAAGVFSATRVASEGVALALAAALLAALIRAGLAPGAGSETLTEAARLLSVGGLERAEILLADRSREDLIAAYARASQTLYAVLAGLTALCAFGVWRLLGRARTDKSEAGRAETENAETGSA